MAHTPDIVEPIPSGALAAFINMLLILVTIWIGNASDYLREKLQKVPACTFIGVCRPCLGMD